MAYLGNTPPKVPLTSADITDGIITSAKIADGTIVNADINSSANIDASKIIGAGISEFDMWRQTTNTDINSGAVRYNISSNWERCDTNLFSLVGTGMTQSSGTFTFPSTGYWLIEFQAGVYRVSGALRCVNVNINLTTNNSTYSTVSASYNNIHNFSGNSCHCSSMARYFGNITDTANQKIRFGVWDQNGSDTAYMEGSTSDNYQTYVTFWKVKS